MKIKNLIFFMLVLPLFLQAQYTPELDVRGKNDTIDGAEFQLATPSESNFLRFFSGRSGDPSPFIYFSNEDTFRIATGTSNFSNFTERMTILPEGKIGINTTQPKSQLHVNGNLTTPWGVTFTHYEKGWTFDNQTFLRKAWNSNLWDFLYLGSTGNRDNSLQPAMILSGQKGILFGKGHNDGDKLNTEHIVIDTSGNMRIHSLAGIGPRPLLAEADGSIVVDNNAPVVKIKKLTGISSSSISGAVNIAHGISDISKILSVDIFMNAGNGLIPPNFAFPDNSFTYHYAIDTNFVIVQNDSVCGLIIPCMNPIGSLPIQILITYEE